MHRNSAVVYDASVLFSSSLRDLLIQLGVAAVRAELYRPKWTEQINDEWTRNVKEKYPDISIDRIERTRALMNKAVRECLVTAYEHLVEQIELPEDPDDRHVVAAAIKCSASTIVTYDLGHFPHLRLEKYGVLALSPDEFLLMLIDEHDDGERLIANAITTIQTRLKNPAMTMDEYLSVLENTEGPNLTKTGGRLRKIFGLSTKIPVAVKERSAEDEQ
ncbi:MAG: PIN domain-containing protein [Candidatus Melainabacteria bacterium]|nr:PIN domain-containing protein [Candidatus Melainabacteria bacterium]